MSYHFTVVLNGKINVSDIFNKIKISDEVLSIKLIRKTLVDSQTYPKLNVLRKIIPGTDNIELSIKFDDLDINIRIKIFENGLVKFILTDYNFSKYKDIIYHTIQLLNDNNNNNDRNLSAESIKYTRTDYNKIYKKWCVNTIEIL